MPRLNGRRTTAAPAAAATLGGRVARAVVDHDDVELGVEGAQLLDDAADGVLLVAGRDDREPARSGTRACRDAEADEREQLPRPVRVGVLVEHALARAGAHRLGLRRVVEQARGRRRAPRRRR